MMEYNLLISEKIKSYDISENDDGIQSGFYFGNKQIDIT